MRRSVQVPSAFVGRYDPKRAPDPWEEVDFDRSRSPVQRPRQSRDARAIAQTSATLARRAAGRMAEHVRTRRLSGAAPSAFATPLVRREESGRQPEAPLQQRRERFDDAPELANRASSRLRRYIAQKRRELPVPSAFAPVGGPLASDDGGQPWPRAEPAYLERDMPAPERIDDPRELARRASERSAGHIAALRGAAPIPSAFSSVAASMARPLSPNRRKPLSQAEEERSPGGSPWIGHNSAGSDAGEDEQSAASVGKIGPDPADLAARAAAIHAAHVRQKRQRLVTFLIPAGQSSRDDRPDDIRVQAAGTGVAPGRGGR
jgi:hypothetical protein